MPVNLDELEKRGRERAALNNKFVKEHTIIVDPIDTFDDQEAGISIHDPWMSTCGRFEIDPYKEYGRAFVEWLLSDVRESS